MLFCASTPVSAILPWRVTLVYVCVLCLLPTVLYVYTESFKYINVVESILEVKTGNVEVYTRSREF